MRNLDADHLIAGAGLLGLALADHLLRRGAKRVVVLEKGTDAPPRGQGVRGIVLGTGLPCYREMEARGILLLEEWRDYLEADPRFLRCGSVSLPSLLESPGGERLAGAALAERAPLLAAGAVEDAVFAPADGIVDLGCVRSALLSQVRRRGGHLVVNCALESIAVEDGTLRYAAATRAGSAGRIYLAAGAGNRKLWRDLARATLPASAWHTFTLQVPAGGSASILRLDDESGGAGIVAHDGDGTLTITLPEASAGEVG